MAIEVLKTGGNEETLYLQALRIQREKYERVLDVGGAEKPLRCATRVIDLMPWHRRRVDEGRGPLPERFDETGWLVADVNVLPWPWLDDYFDYVWACQLVEDIRDPIAVCKEMMRVGKAGFISTVHRSYESRVMQADGVIGYHHHRWLVEVDEDANLVTFTFKSPILHVDLTVRPPAIVDWLLNFTWAGSFKVEERFVGGDVGQRDELLRYMGQ